MSASVLGQLADLKAMTMVELKARWRELFGTEPSPYNRTYLESRLAYRIQELAFGGLKPETVARLETLAEESEPRSRGRRSRPLRNRPVSGARLIREWHGIEHSVTVHADRFEYQGRPYKSLSVVARLITGTRWNGPAFFGLRQGVRACRERTAA